MLKFLGSYRYTIKAVDLTAGFVGTATSKATYSKSRTVNVLVPGTTTAATTLTYSYDEGRGSDRIEGTVFQGDFSLEGTYRVRGQSDIGMKFETFNLFNNQEKIGVTNVTWCDNPDAPAGSSCATARANYGTATTRGSFVGPRTFRFTLLFRF
jgi:hypothetical protein